MTQDRYDLVLYGASGFTGAYVLEALVNSQWYNSGKLTTAVAGRSESKLRKTLNEVSSLTGKDLSNMAVIVADSSNANDLANMARQAKVIINVVGPYRLYGEAVVKAAVENGASHVDISGEPAWLEAMQMKYGEEAKKNGVYVVGACGWDSIPCDLGTNYIKQHFPGTLSHAETFAQIKSGEAGYSFNAGTYQTLILGLWQAKNDGLGKIRKAIMPEKLQKTKYRTPRRGMLWWNETLQGYCLPFMGADKSVVTRSQYYDAVANHLYPVTIETYILVKSMFWSVMMIAWLTIFNACVKYDFTRTILQKYPGFCSGYLFKESGPTREQANQATFTYWFVGSGWPNTDKPNPDETPKKTVVARCDGPDAGYIATAGCVLSSALTLLQDRSTLPSGGGVYSSAAAFKNTKVYDRLESFGITFRVDESLTPKSA
ncbi:saccharopine dehydrogenase NADP binding domain-containing protein [Ditylenchus destructor]|uniref:Saccharopine dehydrogenase NADP binding domain-containing protein n=1 Tax=Ditylenchus destructor TaxID=166010 RepID=A0AAD4RD52_9BILA|nr:saccharopine dehydrogenase NADP binding domain-containing protein [Ditylenchus destructor]